jgi:drug/metabolite transporter (DMT)-like permease
VQIVWATIYGYLLFDHFPDGWTLGGAAVIIASGLYVWLRESSLGKTRRSTSWRTGGPK